MTLCPLPICVGDLTAQLADLCAAWHNMGMRQSNILGRQAMAAISAVEGLTLSEAARNRQADADRRGLNSAQRQAAIAMAYRAPAK